MSSDRCCNLFVTKVLHVIAQVFMQAYVIATSTLVEISKVDVSKFDDAYFKSSDKAQKKKGEDAFFEEKTEKKELNADYIDNQKKVSSDVHAYMLLPTYHANLQLACVSFVYFS